MFLFIFEFYDSLPIFVSVYFVFVIQQLLLDNVVQQKTINK